MNGYNCEKYLKQAIDSVFSQTYQNWEIIFWDNASTDATGFIAKGYGPRLRYFRGETHTTLGAARNSALEQARGELIAFLDTDDFWLPEKLARQVEVFDQQSDITFVYGNAQYLNMESDSTRLAYRKVQPEGDVFRSFLRYYPVNMQTVMCKRSDLTMLGEWFDPALEVSEEYDLFMRLLVNGKAAYLHEPLAFYRLHENMSSIRNLDKYPVENQRVLDKLRKLVPNLDSIYHDEVSYLEGKIGYWYAAAAMRSGKPRIARDYLRAQRGKAPEFMVLYFVTYFPTAWEWLQNLRFKFRLV